MKRRNFIKQTALASAGVVFSKLSLGKDASGFPVVRVPASQRNFSSNAVEEIISQVKSKIGNKELAWMFENCFPNTLDTTVDFEVINGKPDTYVITGDIDAMWLRDSTAQVWPYLPLCKKDKRLQQLIKGVINRQVKCILLDPYANAFYKDVTKVSEWKNDLTKMQPGIHERKWEIDSLCYPIRLSMGYWQQTGDDSAFDKDWMEAMKLIVTTFKEQQRFHGKGRYSFQRTTAWATDGVPLAGYGYPAKPNGLICSMFRPSDDATIYPYLVPANIFAATSMLDLSMLVAKSNPILAKESFNLNKQVADAIKKYAVIKHETFGEIYAYEVNGFGSYNLMDDANIPSLLSLPYLSSSAIEMGKKESDLVKNTRKYVLSADNPFYFKGKVGEGIGGPHVGLDYVWPMSIVMRGITSNDDKEIKFCLDLLQKTHGNTGFMHESFHKDDATKFTRKWFAWANTLFGEFVWKVYREKPHLLN